MRRVLTAALLLVLAGTFAREGIALEHEVERYLLAAEGAGEDAVPLDPVLVTANRAETPAFSTPYSTSRVAREEIVRRSYRTVPQALRDVPGVMVQETAFGQGSPYIRGFTGFRNVFLIDGIRLNNSTFREGPNQYWATVDPYSLDRLEIVKGPASVQYGSDAIGGAVQAVTKSPYSYRTGFGTGGWLYYRGATAEHSHGARAEASASSGERSGVLIGGTTRHFGDLEAGGDVGTQTETGYDEGGADIKLEHFLDPDTRIVVAYQFFQQNNLPRTHRTVFAVSFHGTDVGNELRRDLDQTRQLVYVQLHKTRLGGFVDAIHASLSWHQQDETRDRIRPPSGGSTTLRRDKQGVNVGTLGAWVQLESDSAIGRLLYGVDYYRDVVNSFSTSSSIQGPVADDATYDLLGAFVQDVVALSERFELIAGVRFTYAAADADKVEDPDTGTPFSVSDSWSAFVGNARLLYQLVPDAWNLFGGVAQGFRAPNLSDLTRFDSARSNEFETPAPGLDPEYYVTFEIGAKGRAERAAVEVAYYYTLIRDQIQRVPTGDVNVDGEREVTRANVGDGYLWGVEAGGSYEVIAGWTAFGNASYQEGRIDTFPTSLPVATSEYPSRLMPLTARVGLRWEERPQRFWAEAMVEMAAKADRLSTGDQLDTQRIPPGGTPGYAVVHLRGGWRIHPHASLVLALENLLDKAYRVHGSGHTMPGRNFIFSVSLDF